MDQIKEKLPNCEVFVMAYFPINADEDFGLEQPIRDMLFATRTNKNILEANTAIEQLALNHGFNFINVNEGLADDKGNLKKEYSVEGLHLWPDAYTVILSNLTKFL